MNGRLTAMSVFAHVVEAKSFGCRPGGAPSRAPQAARGAPGPAD
jgi:hypothetical protein